MRNKVKKFLKQINYRRQLKKRFPSLTLQHNVFFSGDINSFSIGHNSQIQSNCDFNFGGTKWCKFMGSINIDDNACFSPNCVIWGTGADLIIGKNFDCGPGVVITSSKTNLDDINEHDFENITIGDNVTIFSNSVISPGVTIGNNSVIGANSVVTNNIPSNSLAIGNPAIVVKSPIRL